MPPPLVRQTETVLANPLINGITHKIYSIGYNGTPPQVEQILVLLADFVEGPI